MVRLMTFSWNVQTYQALETYLPRLVAVLEAFLCVAHA